MIDLSTDVKGALRRRQGGFLLNPFRFAEKDPYWASVALLLPMNGSNGSTTFVDRSSSNRTMTVYGNSQISTAQSKFGGSSGLFDGTGDYLTQASAAAFAVGSADFTVEAWVYPTLNATRFRMIASTRSDTPGDGWEFGLLADNRLFFYGYNAGSAPMVVTSSGGVSASVWTHVAAARVGSNLRLFVNGTHDGTDSSLSALTQGSELYVGRIQPATGRDWHGYINDLRITIGVGRYSSSFTPRSAAFPTS